MPSSQNYINHVALVVDASSSMTFHAAEVIKVVDKQVAYLAQRSKAMDQETRVTVYVFSGNTYDRNPEKSVTCVIYDKDVLRLPSIATFYRPSGMTALIDATVKSQAELMETPQRYGDHAFLTFIVTDGQENASRGSQHDLKRCLDNLPDNATVAVLVPDQQGVFEAKGFGFPKDNIAVWDTTSQRGVEEVGEVIRQATDTFMENRAQGVRSSRSVFSTGTDAVNSRSVQQTLKPLDTDYYQLIHVSNDSVLRNKEIKQWVEKEAGHRYVTGSAYYELTKSEKIQPQKKLVVMDKKTKKVYGGREARDLVGLPQMEVRVRPDFNKDYAIFVQSTSTNRHLVGNTTLLLLK